MVIVSVENPPAVDSEDAFVVPAPLAAIILANTPVGERPPVADRSDKTMAADDFGAIAKRIAEIEKAKTLPTSELEFFD